MKKQTKRIISLILSCLMLLGGMTLPVFADNAHSVQVLKAPAQGASYGKLFWNNVNYPYAGVNGIPFSIIPDSAYTKIEVTTDNGDKVFEANVGDESLTVGNDGSVSFHVNTNEIDRVGDNTLTLAVYYSDGSWSQDFDVYIKPQLGSYANDFSGVTTTNVSADKLGLIDLKNNASDYTYSVENVDGEYAFMMNNTKKWNGVVHSFTTRPNLKNINTDVYVEYDFYADSQMVAKSLKAGVQNATATNNGTTYSPYPYTFLDKTTWQSGCWYTFRYVIDVSEKTMSLYLVKNGVVTDTVGTQSIDASFFNNDGTLNLYQAQFAWYYDSNAVDVVGEGSCAIDNIRVYRQIPINSTLSYCQDGATVEEEDFINGKVSENADSVTATLGGEITGKSVSADDVPLTPAIALYEGEEIVSENATIDGANITFSNLELKSGANYKIKVENVNIASMPLQGYIEIPFETSSLSKDIEESCTVSVNNADALKIGKVMTVNAEAYPGFTSAAIYLDDVKIAELTENSANSYSVRYLIPEGTATGAHTVKLEASYAALDEPVVKTHIVTVQAKDAPDCSYVIDFEKYSSLVGTSMNNTQAAAQLGMKAFGDKPTYSIVKDAERNSFVLKGLNSTSGETPVANSYAEFYAFSGNSAKTNGKLILEFDFYISNAHWSNFMQVKPYDASSVEYSTANVMTDGTVNGIENYLTGGWHSFKGEFDLESMTYSYSVDNVKVTNAQGALTGNASGIAYYRIAISTYANGDSWAIDNIESKYYESPVVASASYVKDADEFAANKVIACDAEAIKINVNKAYGTLSDNDVTVEVNGDAPVAVAARYADGAIIVPIANLGISEGAVVKVTVSHNALLEDGSYADELVTAEFVVGDTNGGAIIVENGKVTAYFGLTAAVETPASAYLAFYLNDELVALTPASITVLAGSASYSFAANEVPASYSKVKCFVWNDVTPLIKVIKK